MRVHRDDGRGPPPQADNRTVIINISFPGISASLMGPVLSSLPVRQTPGSASVDGHGSSSVREISSIEQGLHIASMSRQPGYLLSLRGQRKGCQHDAVRGGKW